MPEALRIKSIYVGTQIVRVQLFFVFSVADRKGNEPFP